MNSKFKRLILSIGLSLIINLIFWTALKLIPYPDYLMDEARASYEETLFFQTPCKAWVVGGGTFNSVQAAVDAASSGDEIRLAGYCTGVEFRSGMSQTVYIDKSLSFRGGYTPTNWTISYPLTQPTTLDAQKQGRIAFINSNGVDVTLENLHLTGGYSDEDGGGIYHDGVQLKLNNLLLSDNVADKSGGGIYNRLGSLDMSNTTLQTNEADGFGGGIYNKGDLSVIHSLIENNYSGQGGGGIYDASDDTYTVSFYQSGIIGNRGPSGGGIYDNDGITTIDSCTIASNEAFSDDGGGIFVGASNVLSIINSTISDNTAKNYGGGLVTSYLGLPQVTISHTTIFQNEANLNNPLSAGGIDKFNGSVEMSNSIIAFNSPKNCSKVIVDGGYNMQYPDASCSGGALEDPLLESLVYNGGPYLGSVPGQPLLTLNLSSDSPAIDAGNPDFSPPPTFDQRGENFSRINTGRLDIGAIEYKPLTSDLVISKTVHEPLVASGSKLTYTLAFSNIGIIGTATNVVITDPLPENLIEISREQSADVPIIPQGSPPLYQWSIAELAPGQGGLITITGHISPDFAGSLQNVGTIYGDEEDATLTFNNSSTATITVQKAIQLSPSVSTTTGIVGESYEFTAEVSPIFATSPIIYIWEATDYTDPITHTGELSDTHPFSWSTPGIKTITVTALAPDGSKFITTYQVFITTEMSDLAIRKFSDKATVAVGETVIYTIIVENLGPSSAKGVRFTDTLPTGVSIFEDTAPENNDLAVTETPSCRMSNNLFICQLNDALPQGSELRVNLSLTAMPGQEGIITNTVAVTSNVFDPNTTNNFAIVNTTIHSAQVDLEIIKQSQPDPVMVGQILDYQIKMINHGPTAAIGITMQESLPEGVIFLESLTTGNLFCNPTKHTVTCALGWLAAQEDITATLKVRPIKIGLITDTVEVESSIGTDIDSSNNKFTTTTVVEPIQTYLTPSSSSSLVYVSGQTDTTTILVPSGAVLEDIKLTYTPLFLPLHPNLPGLSIGPGFLLESFSGNKALSDFMFQSPLAVTMLYEEAAFVGLDASSLFLYYFDPVSGTWIDAAKTCVPTLPYQRDPNNYKITVSICRAGEFALIGQAHLQTYLPVIVKGIQKSGSGFFEGNSHQESSELYLPIIQ